MKIRIPFFNKYLYIEKRFYYPNEVVSLGCDCHPANILAILHLAKYGLPFDWLKTPPDEGLDYVTANFRDDFKNFLADLMVNEAGNLASLHFPKSEFLHEKNLLTDFAAQDKYKRKVARLLAARKQSRIDYLYATDLFYFSRSSEVKDLVESIKQFLKEIKPDDTLRIYFRYETTAPGIQEVFDNLIEATKPLPNVMISLHHRDIKTYGIWGDEKGYPQLLADLGIKIRRRVFPEVYLWEY